ncbi:SDR family oxidoreductase [Shewanella gelidii]|uniref:3-beta hydroxysteroid dehydrogenase n=1 Tax=Shewanella gelidii TaxID=1642821 RepID=A0A917JHZ4_9GAMM|nr:SDR family oxidoreductase [Shewanella gelidii]MCL1096523.1 SDR family oxidoreductase [Shewanella gelidii]GGI68032.1 3-beta hydroxysteroid dehydrogenase [Shewanella gelidii]
MNDKYGRILVAGSTGYLGMHIVKELVEKKCDFKALARSTGKLTEMGVDEDKIIHARVTRADSLQGCCDGIDVVISCLGITRQKDGLKYMDVDYQANLNLLEEAERAGVKKFIYISAFNAQNLQHIRILKAKEKFAARLLASEKLTPCVIRPNGFFVDMKEFYIMAKSGKVFLLGKGDVKLNPIHGEDLAKYCIRAILKEGQEYDVGGPEVLSEDEIAKLAFSALKKEEKISHFPDWIRRVILFFSRYLPEKKTGPAEFFLSAMAQDMIAPIYGTKKLGEYFKDLARRERALAQKAKNKGETPDSGA